MTPSLDNRLICFEFLISTMDKNLITPNNDMMNSKIRINSPLLGSLAKACTDTNTPERTRKVPRRLRMKVKIDKNTVHL